MHEQHAAEQTLREFARTRYVAAEQPHGEHEAGFVRWFGENHATLLADYNRAIVARRRAVSRTSDPL